MDLMQINSALVRLVESRGSDTGAAETLIAEFKQYKIAGKYRRERRKNKRLENEWLGGAAVRVGQFNIWRQHDSVIAIQHVGHADFTSEESLERAPMYQLGFIDSLTLCYFGKITHRQLFRFMLFGLTCTIASRHIELFIGETTSTFRGRVFNWRS